MAFAISLASVFALSASFCNLSYSVTIALSSFAVASFEVFPSSEVKKSSFYMEFIANFVFCYQHA
jgi:hypothetical protein